MPTETNTKVRARLSATVSAEKSQGSGVTGFEQPASVATVDTTLSCTPVTVAAFTWVVRSSDGLEQVVGSLKTPTLSYGSTVIPLRDVGGRNITYANLTCVSWKVVKDDLDADEVGAVTIALTDVCGGNGSFAHIYGDFGSIGNAQLSSAVPLSDTAEIRITFSAGSNLAVEILVGGNYET